MFGRALPNISHPAEIDFLVLEYKREIARISRAVDTPN